MIRIERWLSSYLYHSFAGCAEGYWVGGHNEETEDESWSESRGWRILMDITFTHTFRQAFMPML